ncbi:uncharacterized protein [Nicotiana sylvestris]|uniref:uncharacterized protein n=1 Tax=Nicotiana sylvestris TaxID=4096 RepID=UPI00388C6CD8
MAVETEAMKYDSLFVLMAQSDNDEEDENDEVNFRDVQRNLKSYSYKKLRSLENVLIDAYYSLDNDKVILTIELGETEQSRDDLVVYVVDLNETIANLEKEKEVLNEKINSVENDRDDMMVVVVDLKETIEGLSNEKHTLEEKIAATEQDRDDFLVIITDLEETIKGLNSEHRTVSFGKGKEVASETHIKHEKELNDVKTSLCDLSRQKNKNIYFADLKFLQTGDMSYLKAVDNDAKPWHKGLEHSRLSLLNELIQKNLVVGCQIQDPPGHCMLEQRKRLLKYFRHLSGRSKCRRN